MKLPTIQQSPFSICLMSMLFMSLLYLVYVHRQQFELFVNIVLVAGFAIVTYLIVEGYRPMMRYYQEYLNENGKSTEIRPHVDYHKQLEENTKRQVDQLMKSEKYQVYQQKKQQHPEAPVVLCQGKTLEEINEEAKWLEEQQTQIFCFQVDEKQRLEQNDPENGFIEANGNHIEGDHNHEA